MANFLRNYRQRFGCAYWLPPPPHWTHFKYRSTKCVFLPFTFEIIWKMCRLMRSFTEQSTASVHPCYTATFSSQLTIVVLCSSMHLQSCKDMRGEAGAFAYCVAGNGNKWLVNRNVLWNCIISESRFEDSCEVVRFCFIHFKHEMVLHPRQSFVRVHWDEPWLCHWPFLVLNPSAVCRLRSWAALALVFIFKWKLRRRKNDENLFLGLADVRVRQHCKWK